MKNFNKDEIYHVYQRSEDGGVIFYGLYDRLLFTFLLKFFRDRRGISIIAVSIMYNHFHLLVKSASKEAVSNYVRDVTSTYARKYNSASGRTGTVFQRGFGCAVKWSDKYIRTAIAYVYNNHVEKKLCSTALEMRWDFLAYAFSQNPYSKKPEAKACSRKFKYAKDSAMTLIKSSGIISYNYLKNTYSRLERMEAEQLTDYIISSLSVVDYETLFSFFKAPEDMVRAINSVTGSEHDIDEPADLGDDRPYRNYLKIMKELGYSTISKDFLNLPEIEKSRLINRLREDRSGSFEHIKRFLHL